MRLLKNFNDYLKEGIVTKVSSNIPRANSLIQEARKRKKFLETLQAKIGLSDENANYFIENAYDILIELIRSKMLLKGFNASGKGAHAAEVSYMKNLDFSDKSVHFMNELRYFRNGILYYGKECDKEYGEKVITFLEEVYKKLNVLY